MSEPAAFETGPVVAAVDFSPDSEQAAMWAASQAETQNAPLIILHVVHDPAASPGFYHKPGDDWLRPMKDAAREMMAEFLAKLKSEHPGLVALESAECRFVDGLPAGRIVEVAEQVGARLVVVGSRGRTGLESIMLGSVAERVVQICPFPVVVVKAAE